jgi:nitronate monooxygenase
MQQDKHSLTAESTMRALLTRPAPFPLRLPVFAAPMFLISGPDLVVAACKAGIVGAFPTPNARPIELLEAWMDEITSRLAALRQTQPDAPLGPWAANLVTHSSNQRLPEDLKLIERYKPPIVITALGSPKPVMEVVKSYGGLVFADVINLSLAKKAAAAGVDGLACVCAGAGGHTGFLSPFAFICALREFFNGYITVGGGIADGWGVAGAIAAGADYVYMGTRFIATHESIAKPEYKQMLVDSTAEDLMVSASLTGTPAIWLKPSVIANGLDPENMPAPPSRSYNSNQSVASKRWMDVWAAGQGVGRIKRVQSVADVVDELAQEFDEARARLKTF